MTVLAFVPDPDEPGISPAERLARTVRASATATGTCACGAAVEDIVEIAPGVFTGVLRHEPDCPAMQVKAARP